MNNPDKFKIKLNLPGFKFRFKQEGGQSFIFDDLRKKFVVLTPEEWVRQNFVKYLVEGKKYPPALMVVEKKVVINQLPQRFDLLVYHRNGQPFLIAEFKSPDIKITQQVFDQVVRYNMALKVECIVVSNGYNHFACRIDYIKNDFSYLNEIPEYTG